MINNYMNILCSYGCGRNGTFKLKNGKFCCESVWTKCPKLKEANSNGLKLAHQEGRSKSFHTFTEDDRIRANITRDKNSILVAFKRGSGYTNILLKRLLIECLNVSEKCSKCGILEWRGKKLPLELDHIDGDSANNEQTNLRLLCPNCHSLTKTWRGRSINTGKKKVSDERLLMALNETKNIRKALMDVGLSPRGANYARAYKILNNSVVVS